MAPELTHSKFVPISFYKFDFHPMWDFYNLKIYLLLFQQTF
jgi:hypothetical protein